MAISVFQVMCLDIEFAAVVMSGDVDCCPWSVGILVGASPFSTIWAELSMRSAIKVPRWSVVGECHIA